MQPWLDNTQVAGRPLRYYVTGWRGGVIAIMIAVLFPLGSASGLFDPSADGVPPSPSVSTFCSPRPEHRRRLCRSARPRLCRLLRHRLLHRRTEVAASSRPTDREGDHDSAALVLGVAPTWQRSWRDSFGVLLGAPTLRLRGDYLAIVTLGFGEIVPIVFKNIPVFFGQLGMSALPPTPIGPIDFSDPLDRTCVLLY